MVQESVGDSKFLNARSFSTDPSISNQLHVNHKHALLHTTKLAAHDS